jgi:hypothetical protein
MFILNPSTLFNTAWNIVKGWLDPETAEKMNILKKEKFNLLLDRISED